ncbi:MAG TPA: hypothetical protein VGM54_05560 [Chthoniobacter sp.]|jgi:hypothetical protein
MNKRLREPNLREGYRETVQNGSLERISIPQSCKQHSTFAFSIAICVIAITSLLPSSANRGLYRVLIRRMAIGGPAAFALAQGAEAMTIQNQKQDVVTDLKEDNLYLPDSAIYQIYFQVDPNSAHRWFFRPDVA